MKRLVGTMPENLPTPKKRLKQLEKENKKELKINMKIYISYILILQIKDSCSIIYMT